MLTDLFGRSLLFFDVDGQTFAIRQPTPEEYDDAEHMRELAYKKALTRPEIQELRNQPCSDEERAAFESVIAQSEARFRELADDHPAKQQLAEEIAQLRQTLERRTLAEELAWNRGILARDRYLTGRLLCHADGTPYFNQRDEKVFQEQWRALPIKIKDAARVKIWQALALVREAPFSSVP